MCKARMGIHLPLAKKVCQIVRRISRCCSLIRCRTSSSRPSGSIASKYYQPGQKGASRRFFKSKYRGLTALGVISSTVGAFTAKGEVLDLLENETGMHSCLERKTQASPVGAGGKRKHPDGAASDVDTFHVYIGCFAAWE